MKTIGLIGGMSWESTAEYYRIINQEIATCLGGFHSGKILLYSVDFDPMEKLQPDEKWDIISSQMVDSARRLSNRQERILSYYVPTPHTS